MMGAWALGFYAKRFCAQKLYFTLKFRGAKLQREIVKEWIGTFKPSHFEHKNLL